MASKKQFPLSLNNLCYTPANGSTIFEKLSDCYRQFGDYLAGNPNPGLVQVIKQTIFISATDKEDYLKIRDGLQKSTTAFSTFRTPVAIIAQTPENGSMVLELTILEGIGPELVKYSNGKSTSHIVAENQEVKIVIAAGISESGNGKGIYEQSLEAFSGLQKVLEMEGMHFHDIVRQWNYIEQITKVELYNGSQSQHYQIFNDVRSRFYNQADFANGYPAATGIGMDFGGIIIEAIAMQVKGTGQVLPLKNPVQTDAYSYTSEVLAENSLMKDFCRTTPKFERAKILNFPGMRIVFISGTAAITGQVSRNDHTVEEQTEMTISNIRNLISEENLRKHGLTETTTAIVKNLRVYVKNQNDIPAVKEVCDYHFPQIPSIYIVADICRPELLVEIEGQAQIC